MDLYELIKISKEGKIGYYDKSGNEIFEPIYDSIEPMEEERFILLEKDELYQIYNTDHQLFSQWYDEVEFFSQILPDLEEDSDYGFDEDKEEKVFFIKVWRDDKAGFITESFQEVVPCVYEEIEEFDEESRLARVKRDGKYGKINLEGVEIIPAMFDDID